MIDFLCFIFLGTIGWGISLYLIKILLISLTPVEIVLYRMAIASVSLFLMAWILKLKSGNIKLLVMDGVIVGLFNMSIPFYLISYAEKTVSSSMSSIINSMTPIFTALLGIIFYSSRQKISISMLFGIMLGFLGIVIINSGFMVGRESADGMAALLLACISYAVTAIYFKYHVHSNQPVLIAFVAAASSTITMCILKLVIDTPYHWGLPQTVEQIAALCWLGIIGSGLSFYLYFLLIKRAGPVYASMVTYLMMLTGVIMGVCFLHETASRLTVAGCICIFGSLILVNHTTQLQTIIAGRRKLVVS